MINVIKQFLVKAIDDIDSGNSNISENDQSKIVNLIKDISTLELNKTQASEYLNISKSTFDRYINKKLIPVGHRNQGSKELLWYKTDLNDFNIRRKL